MKNKLVVILITSLVLYYQSVIAQPTITLRLNTKHTNTKENYFLASNVNSWNPKANGYQFLKSDSGHYELSFPSQKHSNIEYKITKGSWDKVESAKDGKDISNRIINTSFITKDTTILVDILAWKDDFESVVKKSTASKNVHVLDDFFFLSKLNKKRKIWIYIPSDYAYSNKKYPVIYMHDGQNVFDELSSAFGEWGVDECMDTIYKITKQEYIVVGIENGRENRLSEYSPYDFYYVSEGKDSTKIIGRGTEYLESLVHDLKPYIDRNYRTLPDAAHTSICGSSMGGLISFYAIMRYPKVFSSAGVFSPAFWTNMDSLKNEIKTNHTSWQGNVYMIAGELEGKKYLDNMDELGELLISLNKTNIHVKSINGGQHNEAFWRREFPAFLRWIRQ